MSVFMKETWLQWKLEVLNTKIIVKQSKSAALCPSWSFSLETKIIIIGNLLHPISWEPRVLTKQISMPHTHAHIKTTHTHTSPHLQKHKHSSHGFHGNGRKREISRQKRRGGFPVLTWKRRVTWHAWQRKKESSRWQVRYTERISPQAKLSTMPKVSLPLLMSHVTFPQAQTPLTSNFGLLWWKADSVSLLFSNPTAAVVSVLTEEDESGCCGVQHFSWYCINDKICNFLLPAHSNIRLWDASKAVVLWPPPPTYGSHHCLSTMGSAWNM